MQAIKYSNGTNIVQRLLPDGVAVELISGGYKFGSRIDLSTGSATLEVEQSVSQPDKFVSDAMAHENGTWSVVDQEKYDYDPDADSLSKARKKKKAGITEVAKEKRNGPISVGGTSVKTDNGHIAEMSGALEQFDNPDLGWTELDFTNSAGQAITVNKAQLQVIYNAVCEHRQAWRTWEATKFRAVDNAAGDTDAEKLVVVEAIDITADWPA